MGRSWINSHIAGQARWASNTSCEFILDPCRTVTTFLFVFTTQICTANKHSSPLNSLEGHFVAVILGLGALAEDGAESPYAQHRFRKVYCNPGRIHAIPEQSDITTR
ncbi:hypothetical protein Q9966_009048 [Columba livia]|nr:hypothetical protein Q9966_009048 [Columba livia]